jgi:hypothetical protein
MSSIIELCLQFQDGKTFFKEIEMEKSGKTSCVHGLE